MVKRLGLAVALAALFLPVMVAPSSAVPRGADQFRLFGTAQLAQDPENPFNEVIFISTTVSPFFGGAIRRLRTPIAALDNQISFRARYATGSSCGGGSPRITLRVDANGDGEFVQAPAGPDFAAHGHPFPFSGCLSNVWQYQDLSDSNPHWEVTPGGSVPGIPVFPFSTWDVLEAAVATNFPNHRVLDGFLVADFGLADAVHYDLVNIGDGTFEDRRDISGD